MNSSGATKQLFSLDTSVGVPARVVRIPNHTDKTLDGNI